MSEMDTTNDALTKMDGVGKPDAISERMSELPKCPNCAGLGHDTCGTKCPWCNGSGIDFDLKRRRKVNIPEGVLEVFTLQSQLTDLQTKLEKAREALEKKATALEVRATLWHPGTNANLNNPYARQIFDELRNTAAAVRLAAKTLDEVK